MPSQYITVAVVVMALLCRGQNARGQAVITADELNGLLTGGHVPMDPVATFIALREAAQGTPFEGHLSLNQGYQSGRLNVYIFNSEWPSVQGHPHLYRYRENACAVEQLSAIVIDYQLVYRLWQDYFPEDHSWGARANLLGWIVSHEVGHLINHDGVSHFDATPMERPFSCRIQDQEYAADEYYLNVILANGTNSIQYWNRNFEKILRLERERQHNMPPERPRIWQIARGRPGTRCAHPTYVIRAYTFLTRIAARLGNQPSEAVQEFGRELAASQ